MALDLIAFEKNVRKLHKALKKRKRVANPEFVHKLRTRALRFESTLAAIGADSLRGARRLLRPLKRIRREAGKVRDMDVLTADLFQSKLYDQNGCLVPVFERMGAQRYQYAQKLRRMMGADAPGICKRLRRLADRVRKQTEREQKSPAHTSGTTRARAAETVLQISRELAVPITLNRTNLHSYRKKIKQLRYLLQAMGNGANEAFVEALGNCKDSIGEWHDWDALTEMVAQMVEDRAHCAPLERIAAIREEKFNYALHLTEEMRRRYLNLRAGRRGRTAVARRPSQEILKAVEAVVE